MKIQPLRVRLKNVGNKKIYSIYGLHNPGESWTVEWNERLNRAFLRGDLHRFGVVVSEITSENKMLGLEPRIAARISDAARLLEAAQGAAGQPEEILLDYLARVEQFMREAQEIICSSGRKTRARGKTIPIGNVAPPTDTVEE